MASVSRDDVGECLIWLVRSLCVGETHVAIVGRRRQGRLGILGLCVVLKVDLGLQSRQLSLFHCLVPTEERQGSLMIGRIGRICRGWRNPAALGPGNRRWQDSHVEARRYGAVRGFFERQC